MKALVLHFQTTLLLSSEDKFILKNISKKEESEEADEVMSFMNLKNVWAKVLAKN